MTYAPLLSEEEPRPEAEAETEELASPAESLGTVIVAVAVPDCPDPRVNEAPPVPDSQSPLNETDMVSSPLPVLVTV